MNPSNRMVRKDPYLLLAEKVGYEVAEKLYLGEKVEGIHAWRVLDEIRANYDVKPLYEDEELGNGECYVFAGVFDEQYVIVLEKIGGSSYLQLLPREEMNEETLLKTLEKDIEKCK